MTKQLLVLSAMLFMGLAAQANEVVVTCRGSVKADMSQSEKYTISLTDRGNVVVEGQYKDTPSIFINVDVAEVVKQNDDEGLNLESSKRRVGMVFAKQNVQVNYKTGKGAARDYQMIESVLKPRTVYLDSCAR